MLRIYFIRKLINFFDFFQQKKILNILKKKLKGRLIIFDVGAHHGETIKNFANNFDIDEIHSFEASRVNFKKLEKITQKFQQKKIILNNIGLSDNKKEILIKQFSESSSTTLSKVNEKSKYFLKKINILGLSKNKNFYETLKVKLETLDDYLKEKDIQKIDLLKIDTEGHEFYVIKGSLMNLSKIHYIYFEHHYDDMLEKGYTFSEIHKILNENSFKKIYKSKMFFRKTFEYIYQNTKFY
tara:strand:- start:73 stop:792 length:720 start_codon:yes stop_codon:yes gene_type:complete